MQNESINNSLVQQIDSKDNRTSKRLYPVYANIYNFYSWFNSCCECLGIGVYHTGIQFFDHEYMYFGFEGDESGVGYIDPKSAAYQFKEQILLGYTEMTHYQIDQHILQPLRYQFTGNRYDLLNFNCNHFAKRLTEMMQITNKFPTKVFTVTDFFDTCRCCIPNCILNGRLDWFNFSTPQQQYSQLKESMHVSFKNDTK